MKIPEQIEELCKKLKPILGKKADALWHSYLAEDEKGRKELAQDIEIVAEKHLKPAALEKQEILLEPPSKFSSAGSFLVGDVLYKNKKLHSLFLRPEDFVKQVGIFAVTGEGKTNLAYLLALQLLKKKIPFLVIDWKRSWRSLISLNDIYPELKDVQVFTVGRDSLPFLWNPFRAPPGADREQWIDTISDTLEKTHLSGPGVGFHINKIYLNLIKGLGKDFYPNFFDGLRALRNKKVIGRELLWKQTALRIFQSFIIGGASKAFNARSPVKLEELLDKPVILELDLEMPRPLRSFFAEIILRWIHLFRLGQGENEGLRHVLFLEEVHNLFSDKSWYKGTNSLENVYREIRGFGQGIVSITQHPSMLPVFLLGNCHTQIYLGLQHEDDIRAARKSLFLKRSEEAYPNMLKIGQCITKIKNRIDPCLVKIPLVPVKKGLINDEWLKTHNLSSQFWKYGWQNNENPEYLSLKANVNRVLSGLKLLSNTRGFSKAQFAQNTHVSEPEKSKLYFKQGSKAPAKYKLEKTKYPLNVSPHELLKDIFLYPFSGVTQRYRRLNLSNDYGNNLKQCLVKNGCVHSRKITTRKGWIILFDISMKGKMVLRDLGLDVPNISEGIVHRFWKHRIADRYIRKGHEVEIEKTINGRPDIIVHAGKEKIAIEIETGKSNAIYNIKRDLVFGFDRVISVATRKAVQRRIQADSEEQNLVCPRLQITNVLEFKAQHQDYPENPN